MSTPQPELTPLAWSGITLIASLTIAALVSRREPHVPRHDLATAVISTTAIAVLATWQHGTSPHARSLTAFALTATPLALIDLRTGRLPNWLVTLTYTLTGTTLTGATLWTDTPNRLTHALLGTAAFFLFYATLYTLMPNQLGGGDVKLAGITGTLLAWHTPTAITTGLLAIWLTAALLHLTTRRHAGQQPTSLPHGPAILIGAVLTVTV